MKIESNISTFIQQAKPTTESKPVVGQSLSIDEQKKKEIITNSIKFEINESGKTIVHFKDKSGEEKQIPTKTALEQSERIQKYLQRLEDDLYPYPNKKIDVFA